MNYIIKVSYSTGDSFGSDDTYTNIELTWKDLSIAKENLQRIKEHYVLHNLSRSKFNINDYKDKPWFVYEPKLFSISMNRAIDESQKKEGDYEYRADEYYYQHCLKLKADNGNEMQISAFWCGYFEQLHQIEIELDKSDMIITF